jgi:signal transduction histidine kinase
MVAALVVGILAVAGVYDHRASQDDARELEAHMAEELGLMARGLSVALAELIRAAGERGGEELIEERSREGPALVRWLRLDVAPGDPRRAELPAGSVTRLEHGDVVTMRIRLDGEDRLAAYCAFASELPARNLVEVSRSLVPLRLKERKQRVGIVIKSMLIAALGIIYALALGVRFIGRPIQLLVAQARRIGAGDLSGRLETGRRSDEIRDLAEEMNLMCERLVQARERIASESAAKLAAVEQLRHADRLKTVGQLASGIAHELGTPLNVVGGHAKMIASSEARGEEARESARIIGEQAVRMTAIIRQLLDFARRNRPHLQVADLGTVVKQAVHLLEPLAMQKKVELSFGAPEAAAVKMDEAQIQQAVTNLVLNAIQAMPTGGQVRIRVGREDARTPEGAEGDYVRLSVRDEGVGMAPGVLSRIFEPFFTTKGNGEGTGLGLSVTYGIVHEHGGWIDAASEPGHGARFDVFLPGALS